MIETLGDHLWQSTLFAAAMALVAVALRRHRAQVRFRIWLAASLKFLVPFSVLAAAGAALPWTPPPALSPIAAVPVRSAVLPFSSTEFTAFPIPEGVEASWGAPVLVWGVALVWAAGALVILARWTRAWRDMSRICREAVPAEEGRDLTLFRRTKRLVGTASPVVLLRTARPVEPGIFGLRRPALLWPEAIGARLDDAEIEAIFAHELAHARRRDNVTALLQMLAEAVLWFHPMVWWVGSRLLHERELACDEDVLRLGGDPRRYAEGILKTCAFTLSSPLACVPGVTGADLKRRIERIVRGSRPRPLGRAVRFALGVAAALTVAVPLVAEAVVPRRLGWAGTRFFETPNHLFAFAPRAHVDPAEASQARFRAVTVRPHREADRFIGIRPVMAGRFEASGLTLRDLIKFTYAPESPLLRDELDGAPAWVHSVRFDVVAMADRAIVNDQSGRPSEFLAMLRHMLAERFALRLRTETRQLPTYTLTREPGSAFGSGFRPSASRCWRLMDGPPAEGTPATLASLCRTTMSKPGLSAEAVTMAWIVNQIGAFPGVGRLVRDDTGLAGRFDVEAAFDRRSLASVQEALREQFGLTLTATQGPVEVLVVDQVARPRVEEE